MRGEREVVSHGGVDFPSAGATKTFVRVYLDERSWLVGSYFVLFFSCLRDDNSVEWVKRIDEAKGGKEILDQRWRSRNFSFLKKKPFFPFSFPYVPPPLFFFGLGLSRGERALVPFQQKAFDEKESTCTKQLDCPAAFSGPKSWFIIVHK